MKQHAIIPIFISHRGCPHNCVFCNQKKITARSGDVSPQDAVNTIEEYLSTLEPMGVETIEVAFFGGSFTGIPMEEQKGFLEVAKEYKESGRIQKIHLSTRPDYINKPILDNLAHYGVDVIELGVQSFDPEVLRLSERGHSPEVVYESSKLVQSYGFTLGIQLMIGLPGDTMEKSIYSANETVKIGPEIARLYPTVVIKGTPLYDAYVNGQYTPLSQEEAVSRCKSMYEILDNASINIIRVGLKSSEIMDNEMAFHPAFRQLVEGRIARDRLESKLMEGLKGVSAISGNFISNAGKSPNNGAVFCTFFSNPKCQNNIFGHKGCNKEYFRENYPNVHISCKTDESLPDNMYRVDFN